MSELYMFILGLFVTLVVAAAVYSVGQIDKSGPSSRPGNSDTAT